METLAKAVETSQDNSLPSVKLPEIKANVTVSTDSTNTFSSKLSLEGATPDDYELIAKTRSDYVKEFKSGVEKTSRSTLEMCRTVYEANRTLDGFQFSEFCKEIGFKDFSSTIRKFIAIGKLYPRLIQFADQLPATWTNIYLITQIPADAFEECVRNGLALNKLSGAKLDALVRSTKDISKIEAPLSFNKVEGGYVFGKLLFTKTPDDTDWRAMEKAFSEISARLPIKLVVSKQVTDIVKARRNQKYEKTKKVYNGIEMRPDLWDLGKEANSVYEKKAISN